MAIKREISHKNLVRRLLVSKKLSKAEQPAFVEMHKRVLEGGELDRHQKLWIETLGKKYL